MFGHWFIVASQNDVKIFTQNPELDGSKTKLKLIKVLTNPLGKLRSRDLHRKQPGVSLKSPHEQAALQFAREINKYLLARYFERDFKSLTIAAEPRFLGKMKSVLRPNLRKVVVDWLEKNLLNVPERSLPATFHLEETKN